MNIFLATRPDAVDRTFQKARTPIMPLHFIDAQWFYCPHRDAIPTAIG
jgi:hypothetical protein